MARPDAQARDPRSIKRAVADLAREHGFDAVGFTSADTSAAVYDGLKGFLAAGYHGDMSWLEARAEERSAPRTLWPAARSVIALGVNYAPAHDPLQTLSKLEAANLSVYARGADYHDVLKRAVKRVARELVRRYGGEVKVFVDTAPVMEKPLAQAAGLGWQGKHTNLVSREYGSWLFLAELFTTLELPPDEAFTDHCGSCRRCLDVCPTDAFPAPYRLDARRCISYLTIEHKGHIAPEFRVALGNRIYGCDDCLAACPWNKFARVSRELRFASRKGMDAPPLAELALLDDTAFRLRFAGSPIKRIGRDRFLRNVLIAIGNSGALDLAVAAAARLDDASPLVRAMAIWALARLNPERFEREKARRLADERDEKVREEWVVPLGTTAS